MVVAPGEDPSPDELKAYLDGKIAKWWIPDDVQFIEEMPHTATGKIQKPRLEKFLDSTNSQMCILSAADQRIGAAAEVPLGAHMHVGTPLVRFSLKAMMLQLFDHKI